MCRPWTEWVEESGVGWRRGGRRVEERGREWRVEEGGGGWLRVEESGEGWRRVGHNDGSPHPGPTFIARPIPARKMAKYQQEGAS